MDAAPSDKVSDVMRRTACDNDRDVYVTCGEGKVLKGSEELGRCGVRNWSTVQVLRRLRGGGEHKDKESQKERKQAASPGGSK